MIYKVLMSFGLGSAVFQYSKLPTDTAKRPVGHSDRGRLRAPWLHCFHCFQLFCCEFESGDERDTSALGEAEAGEFQQLCYPLGYLAVGAAIRPFFSTCTYSQHTNMKEDRTAKRQYKRKGWEQVDLICFDTFPFVAEVFCKVDFAFATPELEKDVPVWKLVTAGQDGCVKLWALPLASPESTSSIHPRWLCTMKHEAAVNCARWSPTGKMIASCDAEARGLQRGG